MFIEGYDQGSITKDGFQLIGHGLKDVGGTLGDFKDKVPGINRIKIGEGAEEDVDNVSACDFEDDFVEKKDYLEAKDQP